MTRTRGTSKAPQIPSAHNQPIRGSLVVALGIDARCAEMAAKSVVIKVRYALTVWRILARLLAFLEARASPRRALHVYLTGARVAHRSFTSEHPRISCIVRHNSVNKTKVILRMFSRVHMLYSKTYFYWIQSMAYYSWRVEHMGRANLQLQCS